MLGQERRVLLQGFVFGLEVEVPVHQSLIGIVHGFQIGVFASLVDLQTIVLGFQALQFGSEIVSRIVLLTILGQLLLLVLDEHRIGLLEIVDLQV